MEDVSLNSITEKRVFNSSDLYFNSNVFLDITALKLLENGLVFGPYIDLEAGAYKIEVYGDNLLGAEAFCTMNGGDTVPINVVFRDCEKIEYHILLNSDSEDMEFPVNNIGKEEVILRGITIKKLE